MIKINDSQYINKLFKLLFISIVIMMFCIFMSSMLYVFSPVSYSEIIADTNGNDYGNAASVSRTSSITKPVTDKIKDVVAEPFVLGSISQLVNKYHGLPQDYEPNDLVANDLPGMRTTYLRKEAADALVELFTDAENAGLDLQCCSGYRDYLTQVSVYDEEEANYGAAAAEMQTAPPGYSEHQTGLCIDITSNSVNMELTTDFINTKEGLWLEQNSWRYGFIVRYPNGKEDITGYTYEPWHIRYLGKELAKDVYESGKTYEEYLNIVNE